MLISYKNACYEKFVAYITFFSWQTLKHCF